MTGATGIRIGHGVARAGGGTGGGATGLALDLGTARTRLLLSGSPVIRERPSAVGAPAAPRHWPVRHGMVSDMPGCARLVRAARGGARDPELARALCAGLRITVTPAVDPAQATVRGLACLLPAVARRAALVPEVKDLDDDHQ
ncbi:hypothetical protein [Microbispora triticiradicis]|uniref:hypothetical protein n=1 Tax=Microbispora triticiradicis TaxID=2200763 RepID=UPI001AD78E19|nr:hypothetical protein [Microbispora triticiradicis]MBO4274238.1 hypothetical protein [Microbispora triticiradicis]